MTFGFAVEAARVSLEGKKVNISGGLHDHKTNKQTSFPLSTSLVQHSVVLTRWQEHVGFGLGQQTTAFD